LTAVVARTTIERSRLIPRKPIMMNSLRRLSCAPLVALMLVCLFGTAVAAAREATVRVSAGDRDCVDAPLIVELPADLVAAKGLVLTEQDS
jgi:hypothetical protein